MRAVEGVQVLVPMRMPTQNLMSTLTLIPSTLALFTFISHGHATQSALPSSPTHEYAHTNLPMSMPTQSSSAGRCASALHQASMSSASEGLRCCCSGAPALGREGTRGAAHLSLPLLHAWAAPAKQLAKTQEQVRHSPS